MKIPERRLMSFCFYFYFCTYFTPCSSVCMANINTKLTADIGIDNFGWFCWQWKKTGDI